jgi:hypothetical protein
MHYWESSQYGGHARTRAGVDVKHHEVNYSQDPPIDPNVFLGHQPSWSSLFHGTYYHYYIRERIIVYSLP